MKFYFLIGELEGEVHIYTTYLSCEKGSYEENLRIRFQKRETSRQSMCVCGGEDGKDMHGPGRLLEMVVLDLGLESTVGITCENKLRKKGNSG